MLALALSIGVVTPVAAAYWDHGYGPGVQAQKGQPGRGQDARQRGPAPGADRPPDRQERRGQLSDDERRALHRDLDKANRELYKQRGR